MTPDDRISSALSDAWHTQSAAASLERWSEVCQKEGWGEVPDNLPLLISVFGASWYFTRYIFYRGKQAALLLDSAAREDFSSGSMADKFSRLPACEDTQRRLEQLRLLKNEIMLQILACHLSGILDQKSTEQALTQLAEACLAAVLEIFELRSHADSRLAVYGMGRMAGDEMTFGSDLDLIFLFENTSHDKIYELSRQVRLLLRHIASAGSAGSLYDVDMRLRPHGTSGALITSAASFIDYHQGDCEIWERQMMTRCRAVFDPHGLGGECLQKINGRIFADYEQDYLRREIVVMRKRVQDEKGTIRGKYEVKRGPGGIMDIDFLSHFLQLNHGRNFPELQTGSTRKVLRVLSGRKFIPARAAAELLHAYDFLKQVEASIRLFDMKPVSAFPRPTEQHLPVAAALGFPGRKAGQFTEKYRAITAMVREAFREIVGDPAKALK